MAFLTFSLTVPYPCEKRYIPNETYESFFRRETIREMTFAYGFKLAVYNPDMEAIEQWIE